MYAPSDFDRRLLEELSDAIIAKSSEGRVLFWNRGAERVFGYSAAEASGKLVSELIIPTDRQEEEARILKDVLVNDLSQYETTRQRKDGALIYVDVSSKVVLTAEGKFDFILSSNKDVTQLKVLRDAKLTQARYGSLLESTPDGIIIANPAGRIVLANGHAGDLFGYKPSELVGQLVELLLPARYREGHVGHRSLFFQHPRARSMGAGLELHGLRKDGTEFPVEVSLSPIETEEGRLVISAVRDLTERKRAEQNFRDQALIMDLVNDSVVVRDLDDRIGYWNQGAQRIYGWTKEEAKGRVTHELLRTLFPEPIADIRAKLLAEGHWEGELIHCRRDGTQIIVASRWTLQRDVDGQPIAVIELNYDITERKRFEQALQQKNEQLEAAAQSKNRFLANMSHELRTPLNGIIGFAEFLSDGKPGPLNSKQKEYLSDILNSGRHLLQLINDILDLAKVEANKMDLRPEKFSLTKVVEATRSVSLQLAQKKRIAIDISVAPEIGEVELDLQKFKQVLYNLLSNAIKFTDEGGRVAITAVMKGEDHFALSVADTGIGIRKEDFPKLFSEFEQLDSGAARRYEGTGLGLALTRKLLELQGGSISVESEVGKGTTFTVVLPRKMEQS